MLPNSEEYNSFLDEMYDAITLGDNPRSETIPAILALRDVVREAGYRFNDNIVSKNSKTKHTSEQMAYRFRLGEAVTLTLCVFSTLFRGSTVYETSQAAYDDYMSNILREDLSDRHVTAEQFINAGELWQTLFHAWYDSIALLSQHKPGKRISDIRWGGTVGDDVLIAMDFTDDKRAFPTVGSV